MDRFSQETTTQIKNYVYRLIDPRNGNTFYVGRGIGNRVFAHMNGALKGFDDMNYYNSEQDEESEKISTIREIHLAGLEVIHVIQRWGLEVSEAKELESALIDAYPGLSNLARGYASERGVTSAKQIEDMFSVDYFEDNPDDMYVIIKVWQSTIEEKGIYDATRFEWKVNLRRINKYPYVFSVVQGIVKEVFEVKDWNRKENSNRCYFEGIVASNSVRERYVYKRVPKRFTRKGVANPVQYSR